MSKIVYPFSAVPNQIIRGGHGAINISVLACILSHGETTASVGTMAKEIGCDVKSVRQSIKYWTKKGGNFGIVIQSKTRFGLTTIYKVIVERMETPTENGWGGQPKTVGVPPPKTVDKEEPIKKINKEKGNLILNTEPKRLSHEECMESVKKAWYKKK